MGQGFSNLSVGQNPQHVCFNTDRWRPSPVSDSAGLLRISNGIPGDAAAAGPALLSENRCLDGAAAFLSN